MATNYFTNDVSLHCKKCHTKLAKREIVMLAIVPPSQQHLAVKEGKEDEAYAKVVKEENSKGGKSARYCPFIIRCRECGNHVGNVTYVTSKLLVCYKVDNLYLFNGVEKTEMKKLKVIAGFLQNLGVEMIEYLPSEVTCQSLQSNEPMKYCDISGLTYMSHDIDSLTCEVPRNYQRELFLSAMRGNTLVYLPTGSGKTLVAAMVFGCMKQLNPGKFMVFIVDRIPLAYQQSAYFKSQLPHLRVETLTGEMEQFKKKTVHQALANKTVDILVLTHQIFLDSLAVGNSAIQLLGISVLVFDEAHHCAGGHPYNKIMNDFYEKVTPDSFKPLVLGLTASPAGEVTTERTIEKLQKLLKNLHCNITMPVQSDDLVAHVNAPNTSYDEVETTDVRQIVLETLIMEHIKDLQRNHIEYTPGYQQALAGLVVFSSHFRGALRNLIDRCHGDNSQVKTLIIGQHMMRLLSVIDISRVLCYKDALVYLNDCINSVIQATSPCQIALKKLIGTKHTFLALKNHAAVGVKDDYPISDRYRCLEDRIQQFICRVEKDPITSRGIIFVCMRKTAYKLCEKLRSNSHVSRLLNPAVFVGHGDGNYDGMAWKDEQEVLLRDFKSGQIKLLVSTSVLEEGLDVPICNLVIRFEGAATLRSLVQSRGRASRRPGSEFVVICSEKEKHTAMSLVDKEENMRCAVTNVMDSEVAKSQALEFKCEMKRPDLIRREVKEVENSRDVKRYTPTVTVVVQVFERQESREQKLKIVTNNLDSAFNVESTRLLPTGSLSGLRVQEDDESSQIALILKQKDDMRDEFRSKDEFICNITEVWCNMMTNEELLNIWLHPFVPRASRKLIEPFHILPATSLFLGTLVTRCHFQYEWPSEPVLKKVTMRFDHSYNMLTVFFVRRRRNYKFEIRYDEFEDFAVVNSNTTNVEIIRLFFSVRHPPRLYQQVDDDDGNGVANNGNDDGDNDDDNDGDNSVQDEGFDVSDMSDNDSESESFSTDDEYPDVVRNFHNRSVPDYADDALWWERVVDVQGGEKAWGECFTYCFTIPPKESTLLRRLLTTLDGRYGKKAFYTWVKNTYGRLPQINIPDELDFDVSYTFDSILTSHPSVRGRLDESRLVDLLGNRNANVVVACLEKLRKALERNPFCDPQKILERLLTGEIKVESKQIQNQVPSHCALIKRVVITPTRVLLYPSEFMVKNRVLRHYERDDFLCVVSIREENLSKLSTGRGSIDLLLDNINQVLNNGLSIGRKPFNFLASSNSQLRNHSCWFVGPSIPPEDVRRWMGDFTHIRCVATLMARMGQCFSTSLDTAGVETPNDEIYTEEDDVMTSDKEYCFSDGVGRISEELAVEVAQNLGKPFTPSAFQVRFAGYKGVLACDPTFAGRMASFRPSMRKFESNHRRLEVTHTSRPQAVFLNQQVIMLLSNLEVPDEAFIDLQKEMLDKLASMLVEETYAIAFLGNGSKMDISYRTLSNGGVQLTTEPFFKSMLVAMHRNHIHELLSRSRILLPAEEARLMMGVMDEEGVLKPGQVFVQYSAVSKDEEHEFNLDDKRILTGAVVVTRNPCLHPGDVRQLQAVNAPSLSHLVDCIVFPRLGLRPHPNEMSGGDLDGDLYFVCWKQSLLPNKPDYQPMDYKALPKKEETEPITSSHMTKFIVDYIRSDQLGVIDNTHKALADQEEEGVQSDICLHLAEIHSLAVDAPKTGMWPKMPKTNLKKYPDFMMKSDKQSYPSENVLGKLYRRCQKFKDTTSENCNQKMRIDKSFLLPGRDRYLRNAKVVYQKYREKMEALMRLYGIHCEAEIFTGCFLKLRNRLPKEKPKIAEIVSEIVVGIRSEFRREFFDEFGMSEQRLTKDAKISKEVYLKASAWYTATYICEENWEQLQEKRLLGLPWIVDDVMSFIKCQQQPPLFIQSLDVNAAVGESLVRLFDEEKTQLLEQIKERIRVKNWVEAHLQSFKQNLSIYFSGISRTLLFHHNSNIELCVLSNEDCRTSKDIKAERSILEQLGCQLKAKADVKYKAGDTEMEHLFYEVRLQNTENFAILRCKKPTEKLTTATKCSSNLVCDLSASEDSTLVAMLLFSFVERNPRLLLVLRVIHRWCSGTGLLRNPADAENISNVLNILFLSQCINRGEIESFQAEKVQKKLDGFVRGQGTDLNLCTKFEEIWNVVSNQTNNEQAEGNINLSTNLGRNLLLFFRSYETSLDMIIPEPFACILSSNKVSQLIEVDKIDLIQDQMQRAYQLLAQYGDVEIMLACSSSEEYNVIFLSPLLSFSVSGVEKSKAKEIARKTGATSVVIRSSLPRSRKSAILEVRGNEPTIRAVRRELENMTVQASRDKWSLMSGSFVDGANLMLFEGSKNVKDAITLTPYIGRCHQTHDGLPRHVAFVKNPTIPITQYMFSRFSDKFFQQVQLLERDFVPQLHGIHELAVHFGRTYLFSVPHILLEDSESVSIAMLRANKLKTAVEQTKRSAPETINYVSQETERRRRRKRKPNKEFNSGEKTKKRKRSKPSRSSFYTTVHSADRVKNFLQSRGFQAEDADSTETYSVNIYREDIEFYVKFDSFLKFTEVRFPNLRWCVTDIKRMWQNHMNRQDGQREDQQLTLDGGEVDIRFLLQSRAILKPDEISDTNYKQYVDILKPDPSAEKSFIVDENLWKDVRIIRFTKSRKLKASAQVQNEFLSALTVYLDEVEEYSRPCENPGQFKTKLTRCEVCLKTELPEDFGTKTTLRNFLRQLWDFAFALSTYLSE